MQQGGKTKIGIQSKGWSIVSGEYFLYGQIDLTSAHNSVL
jgi:hypothetical protein